MARKRNILFACHYQNGRADRRKLLRCDVRLLGHHAQRLLAGFMPPSLNAQ